MKSSPTRKRLDPGGWAMTSLLLAAVLGLLLYDGLLPGRILFSNDGPLGHLMARCHQLPQRFTGCWEDLNSIGFSEGSAAPNITFGLQWLLGPVGLSKLYAPLALLGLGLAAWCFFRQLGLAPLACVLGALAAALNSSFFSAACWGVAAHPLTIAMALLAMAALAQPAPRWPWARVALAGLAVGMGVTEGADIGALFSVCVAAFVCWQAWVAEGSRPANLARGAGRLALIILCAVLLAVQSLSSLVSTNIEGAAGMQQDAQSKVERWDWATEWSLPKVEALSLVVPGLFGYRMDTRDGGAYWGGAGRHPAWDRYWAGGSQGPAPTSFLRFTGGGIYAGVLVVLVALWAAGQSLRGRNSVFVPAQRRWIWFWLALGVVSLLLAFGRFAPFYRWLYALPYISTMRNPTKFLHVLSLALVVLFAYGLDGLWRTCLQPAAANAASGWARLKAWWLRAKPFERRWLLGCLLAVCASPIAGLVYASRRPALEQYLQSVYFDPDKAHAIAAFSFCQVGWFILFLILAVGLLSLILSGFFAGSRAGWAALLLGALLVTDLGRANRPWVVSWDYIEKYASDPILDTLSDKPYEHRVAGLPPAFAQEAFGEANHFPPLLTREQKLLESVYSAWTKHPFFYYNIQSLEFIQMARPPADLAAFSKSFNPHDSAEFSRLIPRLWQLTNTRYLVGAAAFIDTMNQNFDPQRRRLRIVQRFKLVSKPGKLPPFGAGDVLAAPAEDGPFALFAFDGALPRAQLYANWQTGVSEQAALQQIASAAFDPEQSVLVTGPAPSPAAKPVAGAQPHPGTVTFESYAPRDIRLRAEAMAPAVLLLNDRFDPNWKVLVDGKPETLLRCNYVMRGVYLAPGTHHVEFRYQPPARLFYVSLAVTGLGLGLLGLVLMPAAAPASVPDAPASPRRPQPAAKSADNGRNGAGPGSKGQRRRLAHHTS